MHKILSPSILTAGNVNCTVCNWQGPFNETETENLFLTDAIEVYCPCCHKYLGFIDGSDIVEQ